jgi:hypothetical protein
VQPGAETTVVLARPAYRHRRRDGTVGKERVPGEPLGRRLLLSRVCHARGETVAVWYLFRNAPAPVSTETLALGYYWRWRSASFFPRRKSAGPAAEQGQQETGEALAKRWLVAAMACALVGKLERATLPEGIAFREFLVRWSGRPMKDGTPPTAPALLAGLGVSRTMWDVLEHPSGEELQARKAHLDLTKLDTG